MAAQVLAVENLSFGYHQQPMLKGLSFTLGRGEMLGVLGPNGSGKTTLLRCLSRVVNPPPRSVYLYGKDILRFSREELAREVAVVQQSPNLPEGFTAFELVLMGRTPHLRLLQSEGPRDFYAARLALEQTDAWHLAERRIGELSGGERQRVVVARALAQNARILLLDEPVSHLDIGHQVELLHLVRSLQRTCELAAIVILHDLTLAAQFCDRLLLLRKGRIETQGTPKDALTSQHVERVFETKVHVLTHPTSALPVVVPTTGGLGPTLGGAGASWLDSREE